MLPRPPIDTSVVVTASEALVSVGQPYDLVKRQQVLGVVAALVPRLRAIRMTGAAASELLGLAGGDCDAFVGFDLAPWDTAAGLAIVLACGGAVRRLQTADGLKVVVATRTQPLADQLADWVVAESPALWGSWGLRGLSPDA